MHYEAAITSQPLTLKRSASRAPFRKNFRRFFRIFFALQNTLQIIVFRENFRRFFSQNFRKSALYKLLDRSLKKGGG